MILELHYREKSLGGVLPENKMVLVSSEEDTLLNPSSFSGNNKCNVHFKINKQSYFGLLLSIKEFTPISFSRVCREGLSIIPKNIDKNSLIIFKI